MHFLTYRVQEKGSREQSINHSGLYTTKQFNTKIIMGLKADQLYIKGLPESFSSSLGILLVLSPTLKLSELAGPYSSKTL